MARSKGSPDVAPKVRFIIGKAIEKVGVTECIDMLVAEIQEEQSLAPIVKYQGFFPKEQQIDLTTHTIEEFVTNAATAQVADDSTEEAQLH